MKENKFDYDVYNIDEYDYYLPEDLIAQFPAEKRDNSRLLVMNKDEHTLEDKHFYDILNYLKKEMFLLEIIPKSFQQDYLV